MGRDHTLRCPESVTNIPKSPCLSEVDLQFLWFFGSIVVTAILFQVNCRDSNGFSSHFETESNLRCGDKANHKSAALLSFYLLTVACLAAVEKVVKSCICKNSVSGQDGLRLGDDEIKTNIKCFQIFLLSLEWVGSK